MNEFLEKLRTTLTGIDGVDFSQIENDFNATVSSFNLEKEKLNNKNKEILGEKKKLQDELTKLNEKVSGFDEEEFKRLKELEDDYTNNKKPELDNIKAKLEQSYNAKLLTKQGEFDTLKGKYDELTKKNLNSEIDSKLAKEFASARVLPQHQQILTVYFRNLIKAEDDGYGGYDMTINDNGTPMPIEDYFVYWKTLESSKPYISAEISNGSGATGARNPVSKLKWSEMNLTQKTELYRKNPGEYKRLKEQNN